MTIEPKAQRYYRVEHAAAGVVPPAHSALDLATRCWCCARLRYFDVHAAGCFVDDVWMCGGCIEVMDGRHRPPRRFNWHVVLQSYLTGRYIE